MRNTERYPVEGANSLWHVYKTVPFFKVVKNFIIIQLARYTPFLSMKNWLYRTFLKMKVGDQTSFALMVMLDVMFPEKILSEYNVHPVMQGRFRRHHHGHGRSHV